MIKARTFLDESWVFLNNALRYLEQKVIKIINREEINEKLDFTSSLIKMFLGLYSQKLFISFISTNFYH